MKSHMLYKAALMNEYLISPRSTNYTQNTDLNTNQTILHVTSIVAVSEQR